MTLVQTFCDDEEHQRVYRTRAEPDRRWAMPAERLAAELRSHGVHAVDGILAIEAEHGGHRWRYRGMEGWLGTGASLAWGHRPGCHDGGWLIPLGEEHRSRPSSRRPVRCGVPSIGVNRSVWHVGHRPHLVAPSLADYLDTLSGR